MDFFFQNLFFELAGATFRMFPIAFTIVGPFILYQVSLQYKRAEAHANIERVLLDIKVPRNVERSPLAMEMVLNAFHYTAGESDWITRHIYGGTRKFYSLEIVSLEGDVHFFIWTDRGSVDIIESQIYSQYPSAEVHEVQDYLHAIPFSRDEWKLFGIEYTLAQDDAYPIKTYVDYKTGEQQYETRNIDPITPMIEYMGSLGKGEYAFFQIPVRANKGKSDPTPIFGIHKDWKGGAKKAIDEIYKKAKERSGPLPPDATGDFRFAMLTAGEQDVVKAIDRGLSKLAFDCGLRVMYLAQKDAFKGSRISGLFSAVKQYNSNNLNGFKPLRYTVFDYPWQEYVNFPFGEGGGVPFFSKTGERMKHYAWKYYDAYRKRSWFFPPYQRAPFVLNSEELATIFHFPTAVSETPSFRRIEAKKAEPPPNIPV